MAQAVRLDARWRPLRGREVVYRRQYRPWGSVALFFAWMATMVVLGLGLVSVLMSGFISLADTACVPSATGSYPCTPQGMAVLTGLARYAAPGAAVVTAVATWVRADDRPRVRWLLVGAIAVVLLYMVPAGIARAAYQG